MSKTVSLKPLSAALGATFAVTMVAAPLGSAAENPFGLSEFANGYMVAEQHNAEGKCGEGKCGENKTAAEGKCGEGKCGEGKKAEEHAEAAAKGEEGKCGEGKCGNKQ